MLIQFSLRNYKTFKETATLNMVASAYYKERTEENLFEALPFGSPLLKSAVVYGANASGKSKLVEAMLFMRHFILTSSKDGQKGDAIDVQPFLLSTETEQAPSEFEIIFVYQGEQFRYGFETTRTVVTAEWLFYKEKQKEIELFYRTGQEFEVHSKYKVAQTLKKGNMVRENALMLSVLAQFNDQKASKMLEWFGKHFQGISGLQETGYQGFTMHQSEQTELRTEIVEMLRHADLGIEDIAIKRMSLDQLPDDLPQEMRTMLEERLKDEKAVLYKDVITTHRKYDAGFAPVGAVQFSMEEDESSGTMKFYALTGPILETLKRGDILVIDELDAKLHPNLVCRLAELFNSRQHNPHNAQLIFNTHDTNLLSSGTFRRDQIWFTEKDRYGASTLYSLADFKQGKSVRKDENLEGNYIQGKYGAIPFLGDFDRLPSISNTAAV